MRKSRFSEAQIVAILKEGESGVPVADIVRKRAEELGLFKALAESGERN